MYLLYILRRYTKSCLLCFFNNPLFNSQKFLFTCNNYNISILTEVLHDLRLHGVCLLGVCRLGVCEGLPGSGQGPLQLPGQPGQLRGVLHIGKGEDGMRRKRGDKGQEEEESEAMEYCTCNIVIHVTLCYNILLLYSAHPCTGSGGSCPRKCRLQEKEDIYCTCAKLMPSSARNSTREFGITFNK